MSSEVETSLTISIAKAQHGRTIVRDSSTSVGMTQRLFSTLEVYHDTDSRNAALNMAIDEALLEIASEPTIRFYRWDHPAISFGYFGKFADAEDHSTEHDIVRRWTGGGIVFHGDDLTYAIVIPANDPAFSNSSISIYEQTHAAIRDALNNSGNRVAVCCSHAPLARRAQDVVATSHGPEGRGYNNNACFANPVRADVMLNNKKIAGAAQRRSRRGLLQQGSIQNVDLAQEFEKSFGAELSVNYREKTIDRQLVERAQQIANEKYAAAAWLKRR